KAVVALELALAIQWVLIWKETFLAEDSVFPGRFQAVLALAVSVLATAAHATDRLSLEVRVFCLVVSASRGIGSLSLLVSLGCLETRSPGGGRNLHCDSTVGLGIHRLLVRALRRFRKSRSANATSA